MLKTLDLILNVLRARRPIPKPQTYLAIFIHYILVKTIQSYYTLLYIAKNIPSQVTCIGDNQNKCFGTAITTHFTLC